MLCGLLADKNKNTSEYSVGVSVYEIQFIHHGRIPVRVL